jgi:hypothetical protein
MVERRALGRVVGNADDILVRPLFDSKSRMIPADSGAARKGGQGQRRQG